MGLSPPWIALGLVIWVLAAIYTAVKQGWFHFSDPQGSFPFSFKQLFGTALSLSAAFGIYIASLFLAHFFVAGFERAFGWLFRSLGTHEWSAVEEIIGLLITALGLKFLISRLPPEYVSVTVGQQTGWKKWVKGAFYGALFYPLIAITASIVSFITSYYSHQPPTPQVALTFVSYIDRSSILFWVLFLTVVFLVPYVEEILFRGFLQGFLSGVLHPALTILGTSFIFSIFHYSPLQKTSNFEIIVGLFMFSLFLSRLRVKENSVVSSMGMHAAFNAISLAIFMK